MKMLDVKGASAMLGVQETTVRGWVKDRRVPHFKLGGCIRFSDEKLLQWLDAGFREAQVLKDGKWTTPSEVEQALGIAQ